MEKFEGGSFLPDGSRSVSRAPFSAGTPRNAPMRPPRCVQGKSPPSQTRVVFPLTHRLHGRARGKERISRDEILFGETGLLLMLGCNLLQFGLTQVAPP